MYYREPHGALIQDDVSIALYYLTTGMDAKIIVENMGQRLLEIARSNIWRAKDARILLLRLEALCQLEEPIFDLENTRQTIPPIHVLEE